MQISVELKPHVGITMTPLGPVTVPLDQYFVIAKTDMGSIHAGYVGTKPNAIFSGMEAFTRLPENLKTEIVRQVNEKLGGERKVTEQPIGKWPDEPNEDDE